MRNKEILILNLKFSKRINMATIVSAPGINSNTSLPGSWLNLVFGAGPITGATGPLSAIIIGDGYGGTAATSGFANGNTVFGPDTAIQLNSVQQARSLFGTNSELTFAIKKFLEKNSITPLYVIPIQDSTIGNLGAAAFTVSGTSATITNQANVYVNTTLLQVGISVGDTPTVIGNNIASAINMQYLPVVTTASTGAVTIKAGSAGARNTPSVQVVLQTVDSGAGGISVGSVTTTAGTCSTTMATTFAAAITTMSANKYYYQIVLPSMDEASTTYASVIEAFSANLTTQALPLNDNRSRGFLSFRGKSTDALYTTAFAPGSAGAPGELSKAVNSNPLLQVYWFPGSDAVPAESLAGWVAIEALLEAQTNIGASFNMNSAGLTTINGINTAALWNVPQPRSRWIESATALNNALNVGLSPFSYVNGQSYLVRRVTADAWDSVNSVPFYNIRDVHKVYCLHRFALDLKAVLSQWLSGRLLQADPIDKNAPIPLNTVFPSTVRAGVINLINRYAGNGLITNPTTTIGNMVIQVSPTVSTRLELKLGMFVADILNQIVTEIDQLG